MKTLVNKAAKHAFSLAMATVLSISAMSVSNTAFANEKVVDNAPEMATLRGTAPLNAEVTPPAMSKVENNDLKRQRDYPQQPPTIPHDISKYQLDKNFNKCMDCHSRKFADEAQAPAVSVTHYMNRDGDFLGEMSPRRYFCTQCHVHQLESEPLVENEFVDMEKIIRKAHERSK